MVNRQPTADEVYTWAEAHDVPAPDAFAVSYWYLAGKELRLKLAATLWGRRVTARKTGFPAIDED